MNGGGGEGDKNQSWNFSNKDIRTLFPVCEKLWTIDLTVVFLKQQSIRTGDRCFIFNPVGQEADTNQELLLDSIYSLSPVLLACNKIC